MKADTPATLTLDEDVMRPCASITICGTCDELPYVPAVTPEVLRFTLTVFDEDAIDVDVFSPVDIYDNAGDDEFGYDEDDYEDFDPNSFSDDDLGDIYG